MIQIISTTRAPDAIGPYSQAVIYGNLVYTSGQIPVSPEKGGIVEGGITAQATQVMENLKAVLEASGSSLNQVIKTTCFLADMQDFQAFNKIYASYITNAPARSCIAVRTLPKNVLVEVEAIGSCER